ncbi:MAG: hypothetical protein AAGI92_12140 [Pseudomonadota bacterium]
MRMNTLIAGLVAIMCVALSTVSANTETTTQLQRIALSMDLFRHGVENRDPLAIITAASIRRDVRYVEGEIGELDGDPGETREPVSWKDMLTEAEVYTRRRPDLQELIDDVKAKAPKGLIDGAIISRAQIIPRGKRTYRSMTFVGGDFAEVYSEGRGEENIDMYVYNQAGALVCSQTDPSPQSLCGWTPTDTEQFSVVVENKSDRTAYFTLYTN